MNEYSFLTRNDEMLCIKSESLETAIEKIKGFADAKRVADIYAVGEYTDECKRHNLPAAWHNIKIEPKAALQIYQFLLADGTAIQVTAESYEKAIRKLTGGDNSASIAYCK